MSHFYPWGYWFLKSGGGVELEIKKQVFIIFFRPFSSFFSFLPHPCLILASSLSHPFSFFFLLTYPLVKKIIFKWEIHYVKSCIRNKHCSSVSLKPVHCTTSYRCYLKNSSRIFTHNFTILGLKSFLFVPRQISNILYRQSRAGNFRMVDISGLMLDPLFS